MLTAQQLLEITIDATTAIPSTEIARACMAGKNEALFRDVTQNALARLRPDWLVRSEWDTPDEALERWSRSWPTGDRAKGKVDLTAVLNELPFAQTPQLAVEFKFWYWFDALDKSKYRGHHNNYHNYISQSFLMDATKLCAVNPESEHGRLILTVLPSFQIETANKMSREELIEFFKSREVKYLGQVEKAIRQQADNAPRARSEALDQISQYFSSRGCLTVVGGGLVGTYRDIAVTTDFVVCEIPPDFT